MSLKIDMETIKGVLCVRLEGELDHHTADQLRREASKWIEDKNIRFLVFNLEKLTFMDSSGIGVILGRYKQIQQHKGEVIVCSLPPSIHRLFEMSGLLKIIRLEPTEEKALERLGVA